MRASWGAAGAARCAVARLQLAHGCSGLQPCEPCLPQPASKGACARPPPSLAPPLSPPPPELQYFFLNAVIVFLGLLVYMWIARNFEEKPIAPSSDNVSGRAHAPERGRGRAGLLLRPRVHCVAQGHVSSWYNTHRHTHTHCDTRTRAHAQAEPFDKETRLHADLGNVSRTWPSVKSRSSRTEELRARSNASMACAKRWVRL